MWGNSGKKYMLTPKIACSYTYGLHKGDKQANQMGKNVIGNQTHFT